MLVSAAWLLSVRVSVKCAVNSCILDTKCFDYNGRNLHFYLICYFVKYKFIEVLLTKVRMKEGMISNRYGFIGLGYRRVTMRITISYKSVSLS